MVCTNLKLGVFHKSNITAIISRCLYSNGTPHTHTPTPHTHTPPPLAPRKEYITSYLAVSEVRYEHHSCVLPRQQTVWTPCSLHINNQKTQIWSGRYAAPSLSLLNPSWVQVFRHLPNASFSCTAVYTLVKWSWFNRLISKCLKRWEHAWLTSV